MCMSIKNFLDVRRQNQMSVLMWREVCILNSIFSVLQYVIIGLLSVEEYAIHWNITPKCSSTVQSCCWIGFLLLPYCQLGKRSLTRSLTLMACCMSLAFLGDCKIGLSFCKLSDEQQHCLLYWHIFM